MFLQCTLIANSHFWFWEGFAWWNSPFCAERCQRLSLCLVSWCEESNWIFFCIKAQRTCCTVCADAIVSVDLTEPKWNKSCYQWLWVIMPSVDDDVAGLLLTRHILYIWLSVVHVIRKRLSKRLRTHEAHGFSPTSPHTGIKHTTECTSTMRGKKDCTHWDSNLYSSTEQIYTKIN